MSSLSRSESEEVRWYHDRTLYSVVVLWKDVALFYWFLEKEGWLVMLDLTFIRNNPDQIKEACRLKNNSLDVDHLLEVDRQVLALQRQVEEARAEQNQISKRVQAAGKDKELRDQLIAQGRRLAEEMKAREPELNRL